MGLFNLFKSKNKAQAEISRLLDSRFPILDKDINAGTDELLRILNNNISREEAKSIFTKSYSLIRISEKFNKENLKVHLSGYCLHHFSDKQIEEFHGYLASLLFAMLISGKSPAEVKFNNGLIIW